MSFDEKDGTPIVNVHKRTTKVNLWMVVFVVLFFVVGGVAAYFFR